MVTVTKKNPPLRVRAGRIAVVLCTRDQTGGDRAKVQSKGEKSHPRRRRSAANQPEQCSSALTDSHRGRQRREGRKDCTQKRSSSGPCLLLSVRVPLSAADCVRIPPLRKTSAAALGFIYKRAARVGVLRIPVGCAGKSL